MEFENQVMELIVNDGDARGKALNAVSAAAEGQFDQAEKLMEECKSSLNQAELNGDDSVRVTLLIVHAQDHLMNAITVKDLAEHIIHLSKVIYKKKGE